MTMNRPDWLPLAMLFALYLVASGVAPAVELIIGVAR